MSTKFNKIGKILKFLLKIIVALLFIVSIILVALFTIRFGSGHWVTICSTEQGMNGSRAYGSIYFANMERCDHGDWPKVTVWVKEPWSFNLYFLKVHPQNSTESTNTPQITSMPTVTPIPTPTARMQLTATPTLSLEQQKAPKIVSITDSLGNSFPMKCLWSSTHYECNPTTVKEPNISVKTTPQITFTINSQDPNNRSLTHRFDGYCQGNNSNWISDNTCTISLDTTRLGAQTFIFDIKNDDNYGSIGIDATTTLHYRTIE